jgi:glycerophosphoryl diester phosphodiesterase
VADRGLVVHDQPGQARPWTVDDPAMMRRVTSYRVDGIITNKPDLTP